LKKKIAEVKRKAIVPNHAIIVAGHAVVRLDKMVLAGIHVNIRNVYVCRNILGKVTDDIKEPLYIL
jgi:hypothetical protein